MCKFSQILYLAKNNVSNVQTYYSWNLGHNITVMFKLKQNKHWHHGFSMITAEWTHLRMFLNSKFYYFMLKCWILLKLVLGGVDGNLHFPVPSMNMLNQTEPATLSILPFWAFFRDSVFIYLMITSLLFVPCGGCKTSPHTFNQWCYIFDPWRSFSTTLLLCIWYF
jgi:hypothetical protein